MVGREEAIGICVYFGKRSLEYASILGRGHWNMRRGVAYTAGAEATDGAARARRMCGRCSACARAQNAALCAWLCAVCMAVVCVTPVSQTEHLLTRRSTCAWFLESGGHCAILLISHVWRVRVGVGAARVGRSRETKPLTKERAEPCGTDERVQRNDTELGVRRKRKLFPKRK